MRPIAASQSARNAGAEQQVFRRITAEGQFREQHDVGAVLVPRELDHLDDAIGVPGHRSDREIELRHRDPQRHALLPPATFLVAGRMCRAF